MKILLIDDKAGTAIDILAHFILRNNRQHAIDILNFHPKRPDEATVAFLKEHWHEYDIIHWMYWRSWEKAREIIPEIDHAKSVISHFNPYDIKKYNWGEFHNKSVVCTQGQKDQIGGTLIRLAVDEQLWDFQPNQLKTVGICASRIESKKGVLEVAEVCKELGITMVLMGRISDKNYFDRVMATGADIIFKENVPAEDMPSIYQSMGIYVCNSVDNFETGPMPPLEAMLCGVPVISRKVGTIAEIGDDGRNLLFFDNKEQMKMMIEEIFRNDGLRDSLRSAGWNTAKTLTSVRFAWQYNQVYHEVLHPHQPLVSVIVPTIPGREAQVAEIREAIKNQTWKNTEIISVMDVEPGYNLAKSRNKGLIESRGKYVMFLDDRFVPEPTAIQEFMNQHQDRDKIFMFGYKGFTKRNFVENFSFTKRQDIINAGMFNERVNIYGGMSQELRNRLNRQGWEFKYCEKAVAKSMIRSGSRVNKKKDIINAKILLYKLGL